MRYARFVRNVPPSTDTKSWPTAGAAPPAARTPSGRFSLSMMLNGASGLVGGCHSPFAFFASTRIAPLLEVDERALGVLPGVPAVVVALLLRHGNCARVVSAADEAR